MSKRVPSAVDIIHEALRIRPDADVNTLHAETYRVMINYRMKYYEERVDSILSELELTPTVEDVIKRKLLQPIAVNGKEYSNFMEEVSRRVSQAFQPISGNIAELCAGRELQRQGLKENIHYTRKKERTDLIVYHPFASDQKKRHRIEVKNVSLRERATRGLSFDGDSLFGFFNQPAEFTDSNIEVLDQLCNQRGGYCYVPGTLLDELKSVTERFRPNTQFGNDMSSFAKTGRFP